VSNYVSLMPTNILNASDASQTVPIDSGERI
jgi:hypothetical protein